MTNQNNTDQLERDPIHEAICILTEVADDLRKCHARMLSDGTLNDWTHEPQAKAEYDRTLRVVAALSKLNTLTPTIDSTLPLENALSDDEIEALAIKHIAPGAKQFRAAFPDLPPYQQTAQFRRVKALIGDLLSKLRTPVTDEARPTDDALWDQTLSERDEYHEMADRLANAIADYLLVEIGEHSSSNCPWMRALEAIENATPQANMFWDASMPEEIHDTLEDAMDWAQGSHGLIQDDVIDIQQAVRLPALRILVTAGDEDGDVELEYKVMKSDAVPPDNGETV